MNESFKERHHTDPEKKEAQEQEGSCIEEADELCVIIDEVVAKSWLPDKTARQVWNTLKVLWFVAKETDKVVLAYHDLKETCDPRNLVRIMAWFSVAPRNWTWEETWCLERKCEEIYNRLALKWLDEWNLNPQDYIQTCPDEVIDQCLNECGIE